MSEKDPRPVGDWDVEQADPPASPPDNARADEQGHNRDEVDADNP